MSNIIVMAFSPRNIVGCMLNKGLQRGVTGIPGPPLSLRPWTGDKNEEDYQLGVIVFDITPNFSNKHSMLFMYVRKDN